MRELRRSNYCLFLIIYFNCLAKDALKHIIETIAYLFDFIAINR